jgi:hypothetical protein
MEKRIWMEKSRALVYLLNPADGEAKPPHNGF